jgi:ABC-type branched-subunit amino acid transport system substrate-binding protein
LTPQTRADAPKQPQSSSGSARQVSSRRVLLAYGAVQTWAQAADKAGSLELQAMIASMREHQFDTVLGPIDFDEKGDLAVQSPALYVWRPDGEHMPLEQGMVKE